MDRHFWCLIYAGKKIGDELKCVLFRIHLISKRVKSSTTGLMHSPMDKKIPEIFELLTFIGLVMSSVCLNKTSLLSFFYTAVFQQQNVLTLSSGAQQDFAAFIKSLYVTRCPRQQDTAQ